MAIIRLTLKSTELEKTSSETSKQTSSLLRVRRQITKVKPENPSNLLNDLTYIKLFLKSSFILSDRLWFIQQNKNGKNQSQSIEV